MNDTLTTETVEIDRLFPNPSNPRFNEEAVPHVAASLRRFGWQQPIVAKRSGEIIAGHTRYKAAESLPMKEIPVVWFDGDDLEATAFGIADNRSSEFATWDEEALGKLLSELRDEDALDCPVRGDRSSRAAARIERRGSCGGHVAGCETKKSVAGITG